MLTRALAAGMLTASLALGGCAAATPDVTGTWGDSSAIGQPSLELKPSGEVTGTDGCNRLIGSYELDGNEVTFEPFASTMMFCEGVDTWMLNAATATVAGDEMTLFDVDGAAIGSLERTD